ncbi:spermatogenesis- and oogenesis-specific basic helix-loop-helix-containing protein 2 [Arvicola amphibius]|uniref:spermatogenesis- and oogenesis-specific basic helix-loop-helix-containing protein 2 n=1 Tax=Arvicola amphibius TaxID=1047088 RepID=UPI0018E29856|nr:spermatogenesis- and oogenesis-specific basic helix-loop-helix-containing protein 2 [Arvicola amphibius]
MADLISSGELGRRPGQERLDLLLVGDTTGYVLTGSIRKYFSTAAQITLTVSDVKKAAVLLAANSFDIVFLKVTSTLTVEELEAVKLIRSGKKKNIYLLFVFIIPEEFKGCISEYGVDISFTEPLTLEKMNTVLKYWKTFFINMDVETIKRLPECGLHLQTSCSDFSTDLFLCLGQLKNDPELEGKAPLTGPQRIRKTSLLHSSKEKLRRERIKFSCEQLRTLLPHVKGRKSDVASVIEATVDYVKYVRENLSPAVMAKIKETIQSNNRFSKRHVPIDLFLPCAATSQREDPVLTSAYASVREIQFLADQCLSVYSVPAAGRPVEETVRGPSSSVSESPIEDLMKTRVPGSVALSLSPFHAVRCCSGTISPQDTAARKNQNISIYLPSAVPSGSNFLPQHCSAMLCQTRPANSSCRCTSGRKLPAGSRATSPSVFGGFPDSDPDHQASQQPHVSAEPSPPPQEDDYF